MSSNTKEYFVVFDTNILFHSYDKKGDFTKFSFNHTFENVVEMINQLDIYRQVVLVIPAVVWNEMKQQIIEAHNDKIREFRNKISKFKFPEITVKDQGDTDYNIYITSVIDHYKETLSTDINKVIELPIASENRYQSIVKRAFGKQPPFEGKEKKSDKGFKDALLWESIIEFTTEHNYSNIIYYTNDNVFNCELEKEFSKQFSDANLYICCDEEKIKERLEAWAQEIDKYSYTPITDYVEHKELLEWLRSGDCEIQLIDLDYNLVDDSRLIKSKTLKIDGIDNITVISQYDEGIDYSVEASLRIEYTLKDDKIITEKINVVIDVRAILGEVYTVNDVYRLDEDN